MDSKPSAKSNEIRQSVELFLSYWKIILFCVVVAIFLGFTYLRYATYEYSANATIKIRDEKQSKKLPSIGEMSAEGLFSDGTNKIKDEIETLQSRTLISNVVKNLKLHIRCFAEGSIKEREIYRNPPVKIDFFANDSVIHFVDTTLYLKVKSPTQFLAFKNEGKSLLDRDETKGKLYSFGSRIKTGFGDMVLTPSSGNHAPIVGSNLKITISSVSKLVNSYQKKIKISTETGSSVLHLTLNESNSYKAVDILNELVSEYNKDVLNEKEAVIKATSEFIDNRLKQVSEELEKVDYTAETIQKKQGLTALDSRADLNLQTGQQLQSEIASTARNIQIIDYLQEDISRTDRTSDIIPAGVAIGDANTDQVIKNHNELVARRDNLLKNSTERNPVVIQLNNQISALKLNIQNSLKNIKSSSQLTLNSLSRENNRIQGRLSTAPTKQRQFRDITRQQNIKESLYLYLLEKREESAIKLGMDSPNAKIVDSAFSSHKPVAPNTMIVYIASLLFGLGIPIALIYISDLINTKLYRKDDLVDLLDIPYIGDVPRTSKKQKLVKKVDYSPKAEAFRIIKSNLDFMLRDVKGRAKKIFITSTIPQEGKSHTSTNLATSIAHSGKTVLLIETDIRVPKILDYLGVDEQPNQGLSDFIADPSLKPQSVVLKHKENELLDIIPSGTIPPNPSELLMNDRVVELFKYFEDKYDYIIADTSAVGIVSDTLLISHLADTFVYVVSAAKIDRRLLQHVAVPLYNEKRLPRMTMLLNGVRSGKKGYGGYGYGYGYGNNPNKKKKWYEFYKKS
ncbi:polysaccharide biosynthesis tyrosine autokinase [Winogradskyella eckloniae]|uniref:GumC family protein n=1 Tax=Winogradskyella eckloniae TaxID=1089306 RepID=UPI001564AE93|nr:polysaccharide biosynthesis tyrosine autokinase [Winogradskyella eckloniae]NRD20161.1 polysaccharide biosynthesis tyrosine autokinase [Winogradskyella eckloniae]